ncbi:MAG: single-stranded-DNA-specific exonuclease RecJ [Armatimonadota bacterium]|nr:single-stranded-DNA-specific exonuclease RecJ [Armatimonadota bacterium]
MTHTQGQGTRWRIAPADPAAATLTTALGVHPLVARVLVNRGLRDPQAAQAFLAPHLDRLQDPLQLADMARAVACVAGALEARRPIVVYGDYDADGVTATAILVRALRTLGGNVDFYVPDRRRDGYGLHPEAVATLATRGAGLLLAVDCGTTAHAAADVARAHGVDVVILDHHEPPEQLPAVAALVNPKRQSPRPGDYCAAGLALQLARALFARRGHMVPADLVALAAVGTIADAVTLLDDNRVLVAVGLAHLARRTLPGLAALADVAGLRSPFVVRDVSHGLAPRLNAAGRLADARDAVRLLLTEDPQEARALAQTLDRLNGQRRQLCDAVFAEALERVQRDGLGVRLAVVLAQEGWHPGVVGIVASQLAERLYRPVVLIALEGSSGRGSARSVPAVHLVEALRAADSHLLAYGGHAMAAGLSIAADAVDAFARAFEDAVAARVTADDLRPIVAIDAEVGLEALSQDLVDALGLLAPHGPGNPEPVFATRGLRAVATRLVGDGTHLRLVVGDGHRTAEVIAFREGEKAELLAFTQASVDLAYTLALDTWGDAPALRLVAVDMVTPGVDLDAVATDTRQVLERLFARASDYLDALESGRRPLEHAGAFHTKVVGVTYAGRQAVVPRVQPGERLRLVREPSNPRDPYAIAVCRLDGTHLGFLRARLAAHLAPAMDAGARYVATATAVTGGGARSWGLNILVERTGVADPEADDTISRVHWPEETDVPDALVAGLLRGRAPTCAQRDAWGRLRRGERLVVPLGPGRGLVSSAIIAALAVLARGRRPTVLAVPRAAVADAWWELAAPWLRALGVRAAAIHGAASPTVAGRVAEALAGDRLDVLIASLPWVERHPDAVAAAIVVADALAAEDLERLLDRAGEVVRLVVGPLPDALVRRCAARGLSMVAVGGGARETLRLVDRRGGGADVWAGPRANGKDGKTVVIVADPATSVTVAAGMRQDGRDDRIAYYHAGLPATLRRVLEDLFGAGRLDCLVLGTHATAPAICPDVRRVVALGLRPDPLLAVEELALAGADGRRATVILAYGPDHLAAAEGALAETFPPRDVLVRCYRAIRAAGGTVAGAPDQSPVLEGSGCSPLQLEAALAILTEAGVLTREDLGTVRYTLADVAGRVPLHRSLRYVEGERARAALAALRAWAGGPAATLLADLAAG